MRHAEQHVDGSPEQAYAMLAWLALDRPEHAIEIAHSLEQMAPGEREASWWFRYLHSEGS